MMDFALHDNDIDTRANDLAICGTDTAAIAQAITITLKTFAGEYFLDTNAGVPYLNEVFGLKRNANYLRRIIVPIIESVDGVFEVNDFSVHINRSRTAVITFNATLSGGDVHKFNEKVEV